MRHEKMKQILLKNPSKYNFVNNLLIEALLRKNNINMINNNIDVKTHKNGLKITINKIEEV
tara:strand:- start:412 stop:594 length:183 start_codon:yes stop_codon:yes gene_type:complete